MTSGAASQGSGAASDTLLRLVRFAAAACDARYAFVAALGAPSTDPALRRVQFWGAKDYGLRVERAPLDLAAEQVARWSPADCVTALIRIWPEDQELRQLPLGVGSISLPLFDASGRLLGHMGILDPGRACMYAGDRLPPLARLATAQVEAWSRP
jgi:hypothetical protein